MFTTLAAITESDTSPEANDFPREIGLEAEQQPKLVDDITRAQSPPPGYPTSEPSRSAPTSPSPPPFSSLYTSTLEVVEAYKTAVTEAGAERAPEYAPAASQSHQASASRDVVAETKASLPQDTKGGSSKKDDDSEPPPAYSEGSSPIDSFTYLMAAAGGAASILTQVQQGGPAPINTLGGTAEDLRLGTQRRANTMLQMSAPMRILRWTYGTTYKRGIKRRILTYQSRGQRFTLSRDELLTLPEFVLLSLFPNGLLPDGHLNTYHEGDAFQVDVREVQYIRNILCNVNLHIADLTIQYDPASLQYMLDFFRNVAQTIPSGSNSPSAGPEADAVPIEPMTGSAREMLQDRAGIIVLREDLDFYVIPPRPDIEQPEMIEVKRSAGRALLKQDGIFSGLRRSEETGTTEQHLIEMLTAGYVNFIMV